MRECVDEEMSIYGGQELFGLEIELEVNSQRTGLFGHDKYCGGVIS